MSLDTAMNEFSLPRIINEDKDYYVELQKELNRYCNHLIDKGISQDCISTVKKNNQEILECMRHYYDAEVYEAQTYVKNILKRYIGSPYIVASINENYAFRGFSPHKLRPAIYRHDPQQKAKYDSMLNFPLSFFRGRVSDEALNRTGMLHIPFDMRSKISTQRFSIPGVPCLYLATTTYGAWLELNEPKEEEFFVSSMKIPEDLKVLNLCIQQHFINGMASCDEDGIHIQHFIELYPLVIATSFQIREKNRNFKSEYVISQLVMQAARSLDIDGVAYLSKKIEDYYAYPHAVNLAILIPENKMEGRSYWHRYPEVSLTEPKKFFEFLNKVPLNNKGHRPPFSAYVNEQFRNNYSNKILLKYGKIEYIQTKFSEFDEYLVKDIFNSFDPFSI